MIRLLVVHVDDFQFFSGVSPHDGITEADPKANLSGLCRDI